MGILLSRLNFRLIATLMVFACNPGFVQAGAIVAPTGLVTGDQFRVIFVTSGKTDATSAGIATYDAFVTTQAGGATDNGVVVNWLAVSDQPARSMRLITSEPLRLLVFI